MNGQRGKDRLFRVRLVGPYTALNAIVRCLRYLTLHAAVVWYQGVSPSHSCNAVLQQTSSIADRQALENHWCAAHGTITLISLSRVGRLPAVLRPSAEGRRSLQTLLPAFPGLVPAASNCLQRVYRPARKVIGDMHLSSNKGLRWLIILPLIAVIATAGLWPLGDLSGRVAQASGGPQIALKVATFDPTKGEPALPGPQFSQPAGEAPRENSVQYYLVQFTGPIQAEWESRMEATGAKLLDYVPDFALIAKMDGKTKAQISKLEFVRWVGKYRPGYKLQPGLESQSGEVDVDIRVFDGEDASTLATGLTKLGGQVISSDGGVIRGRIDASGLHAVAQDEAVEWIELHQEPRLMNDRARSIVATGAPWNNLGLYGSGQIVGVADTGLDNGNMSTINQDFRGRIHAVFSWARANDWSDPNGHGTHVAGSILGNGANSGGNPATHSYAKSFAGVAPEAKLVMQSVGGAGGALTLPSDLNSLFQQAYNAGARVHSDSWGGGAAGDYDSHAVDVDQFIWNHPDMTIVFAAGNEGTDANRNGVIDTGSISPPATAKNAIAVGASESNRPPNSGWGGYSNYTWGGTWPSWFPARPISTDYVSNNPGGIAAFSSRGPTKDKRIKPDIVAPGTNIISARSSKGGTGWGAYNGKYIYEGGTSMATPIVAGGAALVREYYVERAGQSAPSAALIKGTLLNGAKDLNPGQYGTGPARELGAAPNNVEGWGLLNVKKALGVGVPAKLGFADNKTGVSTGRTASYSVQVTNASVPLRVMIVWSDYPGAASSAKALVNDLDLTVRDPNGKVIWGNRVNGGDRTNNIEGVKIAQPVAGTYTFTVSGYNVPKGGRQPFALVANGGINAGQLAPAR